MATMENEKFYLLPLVNTIENVFSPSCTRDTEKVLVFHLTGPEKNFTHQNFRNQIGTIPDRRAVILPWISQPEPITIFQLPMATMENENNRTGFLTELHTRHKKVLLFVNPRNKKNFTPT
jgi:hypothetical protein